MRRPPRTSRRRTAGERRGVRPVDGIVYEHSGDSGRNWHTIEPHPRSPILVELRRLKEREVHDDGQGNLYRWRLDA